MQCTAGWGSLQGAYTDIQTDGQFGDEGAACKLRRREQVAGWSMLGFRDAAAMLALFATSLQLVRLTAEGGLLLRA